MSQLLAHLAGLFLSVASISWQASVLVLLVLAVHYLLGKQLPLRWRHALWFLVSVRLVLPVLPASPFSMYQVATPTVKLGSVSSPAEGPGATRSMLDAALGATNFHASDAVLGWIVRGVQLATIIWLVGMVILTAATIWTNGRFAWKLRSERSCRGDEVLKLAQSCAKELGVRRSFSVIETRLISSPAIFGLFRMRLLLPVDLTRSLDSEELRFVFLHELAHLRRADLYHHALLSVLQVIHWFNPLLWFAFTRIRYDREMATDALVLSGPRASLRRQYGHTLIKLIEGAHKRPLPAQLVGIMDDPDCLKDRLMKIKQATPEGYRWSMPGLALLCVLGALSLTRAYGEAETLVYQAKIPDQPWNGWGFASPVDPNHDQAPVPPPEKFSLVENPPPGPRVFSGKVVVQGPLAGVEVGLVSLVGVHWVNPDAYQWELVKPDGTFSLTDVRYLDAAKALVVRGPNTPWTFLRYNFTPQQSATDIILTGETPRKISLSVSGEDRENLSQASYEFFPAHAQYDDQGNALRRQRLGEFNSGARKSLEVIVPPGEIAVFAHHDGYSGYYQIIDTRKAAHFQFVLMPPGRMKITVLDRQGNPKSGVRINWLNPAAPLSLSGSSTDGNGVLVQDNLTPGTFELNVTGFAPREIKVDENQLTEVQFREGTDP